MLNNAGRQEGNPLMGAECTYLRVGDVAGQDVSTVTMLSAVSVDTTSTQAFSGSRGVELGLRFSDAVTDCDIDVIKTKGTDQVVVTYQNLKGPTVLFVTPAEGFDLEGYPIKIRAYNFGGGGNVTAYLAHLS